MVALQSNLDVGWFLSEVWPKMVRAGNRRRSKLTLFSLLTKTTVNRSVGGPN